MESLAEPDWAYRVSRVVMATARAARAPGDQKPGRWGATGRLTLVSRLGVVGTTAQLGSSFANAGPSPAVDSLIAPLSLLGGSAAAASATADISIESPALAKNERGT